MFRLSLQCVMCFISTYNAWWHHNCCVFFFFLIECSLTAEMSVKHGVTVPSWKMDLTIQCVLCHVEAIHKLFFFCCKQMKIIWLHSWRYPILFFFLILFFPKYGTLIKLLLKWVEWTWQVVSYSTLKNVSHS